MERFNKKIDKSGECWMWLGGTDKDGYGKFKIAGKHLRAHRVAWELFWDMEIPEGKIIMHTCDVPGCVNPSHLRLGTYTDNNRDRDRKGHNAYRNRTHCAQGHEYSPENISWWRNERSCKACMRAAYHRRQS